MRRSFIRPLALGCALTLSPLTVACSSGTVAPLPVRTASPTGSGAVGDVPVAATSSPGARVTSAPTRQDPDPKPSKVRTQRPQPTVEPANEPACLGAEIVEVEVDSQDLSFAETDCMKVGGVLRLRGIDPTANMVSVTPESYVKRHYEAGVVDIRFIRKGTVEIEVRLDGNKYPLTRVIV